jgi:hypothetical protein
MNFVVLFLTISNAILQHSLAYSLMSFSCSSSCSRFISSTRCRTTTGRGGTTRNSSCVRIAFSSRNFLERSKREGSSHHQTGDIGNVYSSSALHANKPKRLKENEVGVLYVNERVSEFFYWCCCYID